MVGRKFNFSALAKTPHAAALPKLGAVTCDGEFTEWRDAAAVPLRLPADTAHRKPPHVWKGPADCSLEVLCGWSAEGLCLAGTVADDDVRNSRPNDVSYEQDCVELYVDGRVGAAFLKPPYSKGAYHIFVRPPIGDAPVTLVCNSDKAAIANARAAGKRTAHGWTFEVVIPWEAFPGFCAQPGASFGLQFGVDDYDSRDGEASQPLMLSVRGATSLSPAATGLTFRWPWGACPGNCHRFVRVPIRSRTARAPWSRKGLPNSGRPQPPGGSPQKVNGHGN